ncbi:MAG: glycosyltransferase [Francisella endosymbiont of Hyalomma scupense]
MYSAVDLTVVPSKQEGLSNVIMENLSCSTPVVAFDIGVIQI